MLSAATVFTLLAAGEKPAITPDEALARLKEGNDRYVAGQSLHPNGDAARRKETSTQGQHPFATVIACSDSRVPVEILFDQGIGDVFVIRVPGNVCNGDEIASIEYGVEHLGTPLCVVLGHTQCGAVTGVVQGASMEGNLARLVANIQQALVKTRRENPSLDDKALIEQTVRANVHQSIDDLFRGSPGMKKRVANGTLKIIGAIYDIEQGRVAWMEDPSAKP